MYTLPGKKWWEGLLLNLLSQVVRRILQLILDERQLGVILRNPQPSLHQPGVMCISTSTTYSPPGSAPRTQLFAYHHQNKA